MPANELHQVAASELQSRLDKHRQELADLKLKARTEEFKQWHRLGLLRKQIARIQTVLRAQELAAEKNHG